MRSAAVQAFGQHRPELAARAWPGHPTVAGQLILAEIGRSAASGRAPDAATLERGRALLLRAPLAAEPFLFEGTRAMAAGDVERAEPVLGEAVRRDPRQPASRLLLAEMYLRQGRTGDGLRQVGALMRRLPTAAEPLTTALVQFALQPGAAAELEEIFRRDPLARDRILQELAADAANAPLVMKLAEGRPPTEQQPAWQERLIDSLVNAGRFDEAHRHWAEFSGVRASPGQTLFNAEFRELKALPPFNWALTSGAAGVAEPATGGGVHLLHYGREDVTLARQLLLLAPGTYRLAYRVDNGARPEGLSWVVQCARGQVLARQPLAAGAFSVTVPGGCRAQEVQLRGAIAEVPTTAEATVRSISLSRAGQ